MADIPALIQEEIDRAGGIEGLISRIPDADTLESIARVHQALSDAYRIRILYLLAVQPLCVCVIKEILGIADSKLSYHLNALKSAGLIEGRQQKSWIIYRLTVQGAACIPRGSFPCLRRHHSSHFSVEQQR
jgi:DNA-binding transcriptional ArsR family regulator